MGPFRRCFLFLRRGDGVNPRFGGFGLLPRCRGLLLVLPKEIDPDSGTVRLSQGGRRLKATFKVIN